MTGILPEITLDIYIFTQPIDSASTRLETDTNLWRNVSAALIRGSQFAVISGNLPNPSPQTPIVFNLISLPVSPWTGYGWTVGGVDCTGTNAFLSISELRAHGSLATGSGEPQIVLDVYPPARTVIAGKPVATHACPK